MNQKILEILNDRGIITQGLLSPLSEITNPEQSSQFKLVKDPQSNGVIDLLINKTIAVTLYNNLFTFRDIDKKFKKQGDLLNMITNKNSKSDPANSSDQTILYELPKEMYFDEKALGDKFTGDKSLITLLESPAIMARSLKESITRWLSYNPKEFSDSLHFFTTRERSRKQLWHN